MSAAIRLADPAVFVRVHAALPTLISSGNATGVSSHDLRHVAFVIRILELEMQSKSELTMTNIMNLIISDRFMDAPAAYDTDTPIRTTNSRPVCSPTDTLCTYAESVPLSWAMAKIRHAYRSRRIMHVLGTVVPLGPLPKLGISAFRGHPLFSPAVREVKDTDPIDASLQDYILMYRDTLLADIDKSKATDTWSRAMRAMLLASRAGLTVRDVQHGLHIKTIASIEDNPHLDAFIKSIAQLPPSPKSPLSLPSQFPNSTLAELSPTSHPPERITHVGLFSLKSPSSEVVI